MLQACRQRIWRIVACVLVALPILAVSATDAHAAYADCDLPASAYFAGWESASSGEPYSYEGVSANPMTYQLGNICTNGDTTSNNVSAAWTMVNGADLQGWAQSGMLLEYGWGCWREFAQQEQNVSLYAPVTITGPCVTGGETHHVWQQTVNASGSWRMRSNIDTTVYIQSTYNQFSAWSSPFIVEFMGETHHDNSDVPGYVGTKTDLSGMQVQDLADNAFYGTCGRVTLYSGADTRYSTDAPNCDHVRVWTSG